jgi:hypothetical protein
MFVGSEVLTGAVLSAAIFWDIATCGPYVQLHGHQSYADFFARLTFDSENGGDIFLRNVGLRADYTALYPRR